MVNINSNVITYTGDVRIKIFKKGEYFKTIYNHNAGTIHFLKFLRDCVIGKSDIYSRLPFNIMPMSGTTPLLPTAFSGYATSEDNETPSAKVVYTFLISGINYPASQPITGFKLYSSDNEEYANMDLQTDTSITLDSNTNLYVEWTLIFNKGIDPTEENNGGN